MADITDQIPSEEPRSNRFETVTLANPIVRGETRIEKLDLRKPKAGEMRDLTLQDILSTNIGAIMVLIPRISNPPLIKEEVIELDPVDLAEIGGVIRNFFMSASERATIDALIADLRPTT